MENASEQCMRLAEQAKQAAYAPYSHYRVGACVVDEHGNTAIGCNVENASFGATMCAERNAVGNALVCGLGRISAVYIACDGDTPALPCGICRQVLYEFNPQMLVYSFGSDRVLHFHRLCDLLPHAFGPSNLK